MKELHVNLVAQRSEKLQIHSSSWHWTYVGEKTKDEYKNFYSDLEDVSTPSLSAFSASSLYVLLLITGRDKVPKRNPKCFNKTFQKQVGLICIKSVPADLIINRDPKFASCLAANVQLKSVDGLEDHVLGILKIRKQLHEKATGPITQLAVQDMQ